MRVFLVSGFAAVFKEAAVDRTRDLDVPVFRVVERAAGSVLDLALAMGSSEVDATPSVALPQPRPGKRPGRARPRSRPQPLQVATAMLRIDRIASQF
jgi:hypothetical protein